MEENSSISEILQHFEKHPPTPQPSDLPHKWTIGCDPLGQGFRHSCDKSLELIKV